MTTFVKVRRHFFTEASLHGDTALRHEDQEKKNLHKYCFFFLLNCFQLHIYQNCLVKDTLLKALQGIRDKCFVRGLWTLLLDDRTSESPVN